jgi:hypothetical protein
LVNFSLSHFVVFREPVGSRERRASAALLTWISSAVLAMIVLGILGANMVLHRGATSSATDISSAPADTASAEQYATGANKAGKVADQTSMRWAAMPANMAAAKFPAGRHSRRHPI